MTGDGHRVNFRYLLRSPANAMTNYSFPSYGGLKMRTGTVLNILVDEYINTVAPVASDEIAQRLPRKVSSATIRNEMAELEEEGYITRPHISSGGVPSDKGYRFYVESLVETAGPSAQAQQEIRSRFNQAAWAQDVWVQLAASVLAQLTNNLAIVTLPRTPTAKLKYIDLVYLQEFLALLVVVLEETRLRHQLIPLDDVTNQSELWEMSLRLNEGLSGMTWDKIGDAQMELSPLGEMVKGSTADILREADTDDVLEHYVDGLRLLLDQPEFSESGRAQGVVELLEERTLLRSILSEVPDGSDVGVYIGGENPAEELHPYGIIISSYGVPHKMSGTISVLGPTRMEYGSAIGSVQFLSSFMSDLMVGIHGNG
ncbi:MAG: heat-inducible transcription repressor HrcA [Dehalococcoidia bacterium]|nr:heat-inducible transcription repressor HrcA [Dehalococcoidia bacterium]